MKTIRVLHCIFSPAIGGLEMGVVKLVNHMRSPDLEHGVCAFTSSNEPSSSCMDGISNPRCRLFQLDRRCGNDPRLVGQLIRVIRDFRPTVVHTRNWATYLEGGLATILTGTPVLVHGEHGTPSPGRWRHQWAYRLLARRTTCVVAVSDALARVYQETCGSWATRVRTIHNGVDEHRFLPAEDSAKAKGDLDLPPTASVIGSVGRLVPVKGFELLLDAMAQVDRSKLNVCLILIGDGAERARLESLSQRLGLNRQVRFVGERRDVVRYYQAMDVYVNCSYSEGISNGILEALSCGVPVIGTQVGGTPEILRHAGIAGRLIPAGNSQALAAALTSFLEDCGQQARRREAARRTICDHFSLQQMIGQYEILYREAARSESERRHQSLKCANI